MKIIHLSDLHLGKKIYEYSMIDDQKYILTKIINIVDDEKPDVVVIAGDVYDKAQPTTEAVQLFDDFLVRLSERHLKVMVISGNHDSAERIAFGRKLMDKSEVYMSQVYDGTVEPIICRDDFGEVNFYLLPFIKPVIVRRFFENENIETYTDAVSMAIKNMHADSSKRNIIITHQFVTGAERSESEEISVGGSDNVDASVFSDFDYVALGHIHGPQNIGSKNIRYCGTPLKYSFSEIDHKKSVTVVELKEKGDIDIRTIDLIPKHDMRHIIGKYLEITNKEYYDKLVRDDYLRITLTDEEDEPDAVRKLKVIYPNLMKLDYDNTRTQTESTFEASDEIERKSPLELFDEFYERQNGAKMNDEQRVYARELISKIWEDNE